MREGGSVEQQLRRLEEQLLEPETRGSAEAVSALLADDFVEIGSSGTVFNKAQIVEALTHETLIRRSLSNFKATPLAERVVLVTYRISRDGTSEEPPVVSLRSSVWKLVDGQWRMTFHQGTLVGEG